MRFVWHCRGGEKQQQQQQQQQPQHTSRGASSSRATAVGCVDAVANLLTDNGLQEEAKADATLEGFQQGSALSTVLTKDGVVSMVTNEEWAKDEAVATALEVLLHLSGKQRHIMVLGPFDTAQIWDDSIDSTPGYAAAAMLRAQQQVCTVGVLTVKPSTGRLSMGTHWVSFACAWTDAGVTMRVFDSMVVSTSRKRSRGTYTDQGSVRYDVLKRMPSAYPAQRLERLADWHCTAWACPPGTRVEVLVQGTGQQGDGWACGRWAVANVAALLDSFDSPDWLRDNEQVLQLSRQLMVAACHATALPQTSSNLARPAMKRPRQQQQSPPSR